MSIKIIRPALNQKSRLERGDKAFSLCLMIPAIVLTVVFILYPVMDSIIKSFFDYKIKNILTGIPGQWNEFYNYTRLFQNAKFLPAVITTFQFVIGVVITQFVIGFSLALILDSKVKGARFIRSIMMMPWVVPTMISALVWLWIYQPQYGILRYLVSFLSRGTISEFAMLNSPDTALFGIGIAALWKQVPLTTLMLLAGLQNVPADILEAATVDGANGCTRLFSITVPYMMSIIKTVVSMSIIENFKQFPLFWTMTGGGPANATTTMAILSYREAFVSNNLGSGAAVTTVWMLLMVLVVYLYNRIFRVDSMD